VRMFNGVGRPRPQAKRNDANKLGVHAADVSQPDALCAQPNRSGWVVDRRRCCVRGNLSFQDQRKLLVPPNRKAMNRRVQGDGFDDFKVTLI
jgi:hypothetical protein